jgi:hypothetical protein
MEKDEQFYRNMMKHEALSEIGVSIAASAVYAAKYGACEPEDKTSAEYHNLLRALREKYKGGNLTARETITEMDVVKSTTRKIPPQS